MALPYLGAKISLISNVDIRYQVRLSLCLSFPLLFSLQFSFFNLFRKGTLYTIDVNEASVALQNVVCHGTEGRGDPNRQVLISKICTKIAL